MQRAHIFSIACLFLFGNALAITPPQAEFFEQRIRPVLAQECYECHSTLTKKKGGLLLDSRAGIEAGGESGAVIKPGDPKGSLLIQTIRHEHEDLKMPKAGAKLEAKVIADFERWVADGAPDPRDAPPSKEQLSKETDWQTVLQRRKQWWAMEPLKDAAPQVKNSAVADHYLSERLQKEAITSAGTAAPSQILRRLHYVLNGLPPSPAQLSAFEAAAKQDLASAVRKAADDLLASPQFGETWARHFMDWVRYAETHGSEGDAAIPYAWRYRDYLIRAFNADVPYAQMIREAIAGDLLPKPRLADGLNESTIGAAQLRMVLHGFSPVDTLDEKVTFTDNQIDTVSKAFLGMTVSCARCHNHKFDAISQTDFYSWFGIFTSTHPGVVDATAPSVGDTERKQLQALKPAIKQAVASAWLKTLPNKESQPTPPSPAPTQRFTAAKQWFTSGRGLDQGRTQAGEFSIALDGDKVIERLYSSGYVSDLLSSKQPATLWSNRFKNEGGTLWFRIAGDGGLRARYVVQSYPRTGTIHKAVVLDKAEKPEWKKLDLDYWKGDEIHLEITTAADMPGENKPDARSWFAVSDIAITHDDKPPYALPVEPQDLRACILAWQNDQLSDAQAGFLAEQLRAGKLPNTLAAIPEVAKLVAQYREVEARLPMPVRAPGLLEGSPADAALFVRGDHKQPSTIVPRHFMEAIDPRPYATKQSGRLELASSIADFESNPLAARVIVNRVWHHVFGRGIVRTTDNFGRLGELPTHPELLDALAVRFIRQGGSIKTLLRELVTSETFRRSDRAAMDLSKKDPDNLLLSHWTVRRLEAEAIRDSIASLSGLLDLTPYGEPVGGRDPRRSVYVKVIRNALDPFLTTFDAPVPGSTRGVRDATNVPAQSLMLLNDDRLKDWASRWANRSKDAGDDQQRVQRLFAEAFNRKASTEEQQAALAFVDHSRHAGDAEQAQLAKLEAQDKDLAAKINALLAPARQSLIAHRGKPALAASLPEAWAEWDFQADGRDAKGRLPLTLQGDARIENGALVLNGSNGYARSALLPATLKLKTLEAWVQLDRLDQSGGGVLTVQDNKGNVFDSIVFAEKQPQHWMAGSDFSHRTKSFDGPAEADAATQTVHLAIVYDADGTITGYRNGKPYGASYKSNGPVSFEEGQAEVLLGCRHGTGGGNRLLHGKILRARLYDRALSAEEITRSREAEGTLISDADVIATLSDAQRQTLTQLQQQQDSARQAAAPLREQLKSLGTPDQPWESLALSLINLKEFIYLR